MRGKRPASVNPTSVNPTTMADLKLHAYQERAIEFCMDNPSAYLAIDMGLGKTAISLKVIEVKYHEVTPDGSLRHPRFYRWRDDK